MIFSGLLAKVYGVYLYKPFFMPENICLLKYYVLYLINYGLTLSL